MKVQSILTVKGTAVATVQPIATVAEAVALLREHRIGALVVSNDGLHVDGILSERDIVRRLADDGVAVLEASVAEVMTAEVTTCSPNDTVDELMALMTELRIRHIPVVVDEELQGLVSIGDVVKHHVAHLETENQAMHSYITTGR
jgi:CBS domain-containing protein